MIDIQEFIHSETEAINTMDSKGEVLLTIMVSLAQQESQSMSQNIKMGLQYRYQQGKVQINHNHFLGYTKDKDGHLIVDPEQAEVVRHIFYEYLSGSSMAKIAAGLEADGILTGGGKTKWWTSTINKILRNEKYMGDALLQKTYTTDFLTKKRVKNTGIVPQYYVEDDHEAIIPKEIFMQVQAELVRRRVVHVSPTGQKRSYTCSHCFAQAVFCGQCGELQEELIARADSRENYDAIADEILRLRSQQEQAMADSHSREETMKRIRELQAFVGSQSAAVTAFDEDLVKRLVQRITVYPDHFTVAFKSGVTVEIEE